GPPGRNRQAAISTATATIVTSTVTSRLPNSIHVWNMGSPRVCAATRLPRVHCGQSGQPSPDLLSRTAAPVTMMPALEITPATAIGRMETGLGAQTASTARRSRAAAPASRDAGGGGVGSAVTPPIVGAARRLCTISIASLAGASLGRAGGAPANTGEAGPRRRDTAGPALGPAPAASPLPFRRRFAT